MYYFKKKIQICTPRVRKQKNVAMKKRRRATVGVRPADQCADGEPACVNEIRYQLRIVQNISGCSTATLNLVLQKLQPFLKGCSHIKNLKMTRVRTRKESPYKKSLHGCIGCHAFVFGPQCRDRVCPGCGQQRYDDNGKANEVFLVV